MRAWSGRGLVQFRAGAVALALGGLSELPWRVTMRGRTLGIRVFGLVAASMLLVSCQQAAPWWQLTSGSGVSTCGYPAAYRLNGAVSAVGSCAGDLSDSANTVPMMVGDTIEIHDSSSRAHPTSTDPSILKRSGTSSDGVVTFTARSAGKVAIQAMGICNSSDGKTQTSGPCPIVNVKVAAR